MTAVADETAADRSGGEAAADEVVRLREETLRLRDALISKDAELGDALGRVAELEAYLLRYETISARHEAMLKSTSWRLMWALGKPLRWLRNRRP